MANKAARKQPAARQPGAAAPASRDPSADVAVVSGREPCPCGSGRRYKACHGRDAGLAAEQFVARPFEGLPGECDWVAMREIVPAATARLQLTGELAGREATLATVLPMAWPGLVRQDGAVFVGLQVPGGSGDASRDVADALERALDAEPGMPIMQPTLPAPGRRLQDLLDAQAPLDVEVHSGFDFWLEGVDDRSPEVVASMERANEAVVPTTRLASVEAAYWCEIRDRNHLRWVMPHDEDALLDALARLHVKGADRVGQGLALRRRVPRRRTGRAGVGPRAGHGRRLAGGPGHRVRRPAGRGDGRPEPARRRPAAGARGAAQPSADPALNVW